MAFGGPVPEERKCHGVSKRTGNPCPNYAMLGEQFCSSHHPDPEKRSLVARDPRAAKKLSAAKQRRRREDDEHREWLRSLGLREQVKARIEDKASQIVDRLMALAQDPDPQVSLRAIDALWNRSYGRAPSTTINLNADMPVNPLVEAFAALSSEERRALLRVGQQTPHEPPLLEQGGGS